MVQTCVFCCFHITRENFQIAASKASSFQMCKCVCSCWSFRHFSVRLGCWSVGLSRVPLHVAVCCMTLCTVATLLSHVAAPAAFCCPTSWRDGLAKIPSPGRPAGLCLGLLRVGPRQAAPGTAGTGGWWQRGEMWPPWQGGPSPPQAWAPRGQHAVSQGVSGPRLCMRNGGGRL